MSLLKHPVDLKYAATYEEAMAWVAQGHEPVECSFGERSAVGPLKLDHHGELCDEVPVSLKAARLALDPNFTPLHKFVVAGMPDADAIYAILVLSGNIAPDEKIAAALAELDLDPIGIDRASGVYLREAIFQMSGPKVSSLEGYYDALEVGMTALDKKLSDPTLVSQAYAYEKKRWHSALRETRRLSHKVMLVESNEASRDIWHTMASIVVQYKPMNQVITFSGCGEKGALRTGTRSVFDLLGEEGLTKLYPLFSYLYDGECGGRPDIGGSPRGKVMDYDEAIRAYNILVELGLQKKWDLK